MSCTSETEASAEEATEERAPAAEKRRGRLLRDEHGYYVIDADRINEPVSYTHLTLPTTPYV